MAIEVASTWPGTGTHERLTWASAGLTPEALGLESTEALFAPAPALARFEVLEQSSHRQRLRFALPGSPDARGKLTGRPGPLGTGFLWLTVHRGGLGELLRARCTAPRSASLAEREWNLLCHLRAHGVGTPEPLLVGARGAGFVSTHSFLLVRAPEDAFPLPRWLRTDGIGEERARGLRSLGQTLALVRRAGVELPALRAEHLYLAPSGSGECETHAGEPDAREQRGLRKNKLPGVLVTEVIGGRMRARASEGTRWLAPLLADLAEVCTAEERERLVALALA